MGEVGRLQPANRGSFFSQLDAEPQVLAVSCDDEGLRAGGGARGQVEGGPRCPKK